MISKPTVSHGRWSRAAQKNELILHFNSGDDRASGVLMIVNHPSHPLRLEVARESNVVINLTSQQLEDLLDFRDDLWLVIEELQASRRINDGT